MNHYSSDQIAQAPEASLNVHAAVRPVLSLTAWLSTLVLSNLPLIVARDILGTDVPWILPAWIGASLLFIAATYVWPVLKPLRGYFILMASIMLLVFGIGPWVFQTTFWRNLFPAQPIMIEVLGGRVLLIFQTLIVLLLVPRLGVKRREAFLTIGNLKAAVGEQPETSPRGRRLGWHVLGPLVTLFLGGLFALFMATQNVGGTWNFAAVIPWLPLIVLCAALNAFGEEAMYRAAPMSLLIPAVGTNHAIWLTAVWFGLGHYYGGVPSGPIGFVQTALLALLFGRMMVDTRGMGWPWILHFVLDTVIYLSFVFLA